MKLRYIIFGAIILTGNLYSATFLTTDQVLNKVFNSTAIALNTTGGGGGGIASNVFVTSGSINVSNFPSNYNVTNSTINIANFPLIQTIKDERYAGRTYFAMTEKLTGTTGAIINVVGYMTKLVIKVSGGLMSATGSWIDNSNAIEISDGESFEDTFEVPLSSPMVVIIALPVNATGYYYIGGLR